MKHFKNKSLLIFNKYMAGRPPGAKNKLRINPSIYFEHKNYNPFEAMLRISTIAELEADYALAGQMHRELAKYYAPQLKAVDHTGNIDGNHNITVIKHVIVDPQQ